ncbi:hypothetical protein FA95DRAFT_1612943 [Auriscalpium vulgare]|uniref:Uncharacterized protein n=1 Tax=Auriscalpium vulgare TaxID=40419 RepID=A0ACB8R4E5_9AGAM|nr:hypothetical protein FA95DRAFT_1612943 [Auriscalpium vulgare]
MTDGNEDAATGTNLFGVRDIRELTGLTGDNYRRRKRAPGSEARRVRRKVILLDMTDDESDEHPANDADPATTENEHTEAHVGLDDGSVPRNGNLDDGSVPRNGNQSEAPSRRKVVILDLTNDEPEEHHAEGADIATTQIEHTEVHSAGTEHANVERAESPVDPASYAMPFEQEGVKQSADTMAATERRPNTSGIAVDLPRHVEEPVDHHTASAHRDSAQRERNDGRAVLLSERITRMTPRGPHKVMLFEQEIGHSAGDRADDHERRSKTKGKTPDLPRLFETPGEQHDPAPHEDTERGQSNGMRAASLSEKIARMTPRSTQKARLFDQEVGHLAGDRAGAHQRHPKTAATTVDLARLVEPPGEQHTAAAPRKAALSESNDARAAALSEKIARMTPKSPHKAKLFAQGIRQASEDHAGADGRLPKTTVDRALGEGSSGRQPSPDGNALQPTSTRIEIDPRTQVTSFADLLDKWRKKELQWQKIQQFRSESPLHADFREGLLRRAERAFVIWDVFERSWMTGHTSAKAYRAVITTYDNAMQEK